MTDPKPERIEVGGYVFRRDENGEWWVNKDAPVWESMGKGDCANVALLDALLAARAEVERLKAPPVLTVTHDNAARYVDPYEGVRAEERARIRKGLLGWLKALQAATPQWRSIVSISAVAAQVEATCGPTPAPDPKEKHDE